MMQFQSENNRLCAREESMFQFGSKGRKKPVCQFEQSGRDSLLFSLLFYSDLQLIIWGPPNQGGTISFIQYVDSNVNLMKKHFADTYGIMFDQCLGTQDPVKLTKLIITDDNFQIYIHLQPGPSPEIQNCISKGLLITSACPFKRNHKYNMSK